MGSGGMESMRKGIFLILHFYRNCTQLNLQGIVDVLSKVSGASLDKSNRSYRKQPLVWWSSQLMFHQSTHFYILPAALIFQNKVDNVLLTSLITLCLKFKIRPVSPDIQGRRWLAKMRLTTNVSYSVGQPISIVTWFPHPFSSHLLPATKFAQPTTQGRNSQSEQNGRDLLMHTFI
jgi:hypothetical protein